MNETAGRAWHAMRSLVHDKYARRADVSAATGLSFVRVKALRRLSARPMTQRELGDDLSIDPSYTTNVVHDLEQRGLVERRVHPTDRRVRIVSVTAAGSELADQAERILDEPPPVLLDLDPAELEALDRILDRLLTAAPVDRQQAASSVGTRGGPHDSGSRHPWPQP